MYSRLGDGKRKKEKQQTLSCHPVSPKINQKQSRANMDTEKKKEEQQKQTASFQSRLTEVSLFWPIDERGIMYCDTMKKTRTCKGKSCSGGEVKSLP